MINFTYAMLIVIVISIIFICIPESWYNKSKFNYMIVGMWGSLLSIGILVDAWIVYLFMKWIR